LKLKMAENSLFAILLRSPWWASLGIAVVLALLMRLLLPAQYAVAGMLGSFPFVVIAAMAAWKQLRAPSAKQMEAALSRLRSSSQPELLAEAERGFGAQGYAVRRHEGPGADLVLTRAGREELISLRRWKAASIGVEPLRELHAACERAQAAGGIYVHAGAPSEKAIDFARQHRLRLMPVAEMAQQLLAGGALRG
jgi:restriction system protein